MAIATEPARRFMERLGDKLRERPVPLSGTLELTWRCNFDCVHCYLRGARPAGPELDAAGFARILDGAAEAGCLGIALTGGEPLLHPGFREIHAHAVRRGFLASVFTNGSLVDADTAAFLADNPPRCAEVTIYGASEEVYARVTGSPDNRAAAMRGIEHLLERGIHVILKGMLLAPLSGEIEAMRGLAAGLGLDLRLDPSVGPTLRGDGSPTKLRMGPEEAVREELSSRERLARMREWDRQRRTCPRGADEAPCGAGLFAFHVDPTGRLMPCLMLRDPNIPLSGGESFARAWNSLVLERADVYNEQVPCRGCELWHLCSYCPGLASLGEPVPDGATGFHCRVARARATRVRAGAGPEALEA